jgi:hypothetical protein
MKEQPISTVPRMVLFPGPAAIVTTTAMTSMLLDYLRRRRESR